MDFLEKIKEIEMANVKQIKNRVKKIEGFDVLLLNENRRSFRSDKILDFNYNYKKAASSATTARQWINRRIPNWVDAAILDGDGNVVHGKTHLGTVRRSYA